MGWFGPTFSDDLGDRSVRRLRHRLQRGDVGVVRRILDAAHGDWLRRDFYIDRLMSTPIDLEILDQWVDASPREAMPYLIRGSRNIAWAWEARGEGAADTVSEEGWRQFSDRLGRALEDLQQAAELDQADPLPWARLVTVARGLRLDRPDAIGYFQEAVKRDAEHRVAHLQLLQYLAPKWQGSFEELAMIRNKSVARAKDGSPLTVMSPVAHFEAAVCLEVLGKPAEAERYFLSDEVRQDLQQSAAKGPEHRNYPTGVTAVQDANWWAYAFWRAGDATRTRRYLRTMRGRVAPFPWGYGMDPKINYQAARSLAKKG